MLKAHAALHLEEAATGSSLGLRGEDRHLALESSAGLAEKEKKDLHAVAGNFCALPFPRTRDL